MKPTIALFLLGTAVMSSLPVLANRQEPDQAAGIESSQELENCRLVKTEAGDVLIDFKEEREHFKTMLDGKVTILYLEKNVEEQTEAESVESSPLLQKESPAHENL